MNNYLFQSKIDICFRHLESGNHLLSPSCLNIVLMNGQKGCRVVINGTNAMNLSPYTLFLTGKDCRIETEIPEEGSAIVLMFDYVGKYCDHKICTYLEGTKQTFKKSTSILPMDEGLKGYFTTMDMYLVDVFDEIPFREIKYKEFFYILCRKLETSDFAEFLHPAMSWYDPVFRRKVMDNFQNSYRVKTLAADCGYSEKEFVDKFKEEFGVVPGKWLKEQIHNVIVKKLSIPDIPFKQVTKELKMSSVQSFSRYCKRNFGITPTKLREELAGK